jgi:hypothetical protein
MNKHIYLYIPNPAVPDPMIATLLIILRPNTVVTADMELAIT